ncbi:MAG: serine hydrolase domain-containing protein, partial [Chitinophagales bacterium]
MKYFSILLIALLASSCSKQTWEIAGNTCTLNEDINVNYSKASQLQNLIDKYASNGLPGVALVVYSPEGYWAGASGYAKLENKTLMQPCHLQYSQSVSKTYLAVAILKLNEEGKINLDEKITKYLPEEVTEKVIGAEKVTVRQLMNHTAGVPEYNDKPAYVSYLLEHPLH